MVHYKLSYFDARGLAEPIRLLLHYVDDEFEDIRYTRESWPEVKENIGSTVFPVLEVEGQKIERGYHILRYLAHKHSLAGKDAWEEAQVDSIADYNREVYLELAPYIYIKAGYKQGIVEEARDDVFLPGIKRHLPTYIKILKESGSSFLVKSGVTWVDFVLAEFLFTMKNMEPEIMKEYPELEAYMKRVYSLPRIKEYVEKRPTREL